jgi:hypothetical protein
MMVRQPLVAIGSPLAQCDYHSAAAPWRSRYLSVPVQGRGAAGRHLTKSAFMDCLASMLEKASLEELRQRQSFLIGGMRSAMARDYALPAAIASAASSLWRRDYQQRLRAQLRSAARQATAACEAKRGQYACALEGACGTGSCRFARGVMAAITVPAGEGRVPRPGNHQDPHGYSLAQALAALEAAQPMRIGVRVSDGDAGQATEGRTRAA